MKKTVIIAIFLIYLGSIIAVNFFGLQIVQYESNQYVSDITIEGIVINNDETIEVREQTETDGTIWYRFRFTKGEYSDSEESLATNPNNVTINYSVYPENATNKKLDFLYDEAQLQGKIIVLSEENKIVFLQMTTVTLTLKPQDGGNITKIIKISAVA